jgi:hypothetical protein
MIGRTFLRRLCKTSQGLFAVASDRVARVALFLLPALMACCASGAWAYPSHRLPDGPRFLKLDASTRTVLDWQAITRAPKGRFVLLRGNEADGLRVAAVLPALEGSHRYRYVDEEVAADSGTVYQLVYREGDGPDLVLITARVERPELRSPDAGPSPTRDAPLARGVHPWFPLAAPALSRLPQTAQNERDGWREPPSPPPKRSVVA